MSRFIFWIIFFLVSNMKGGSSVPNLFLKTQFINKILDRSRQVDVVYTDFTKAFDLTMPSY